MRLSVSPCVFFFFFFLHHLVDRQVSIELHHGPAGAEGVIARGNVHGSLVENGRNHLRGYKTLPDHLVEAKHIVRQIPPHTFRRARHIGRADSFVGFLRVFLGFEEIGLLGQILLAVSGSDLFANLCQRVVGNPHGIGTHVGDQRNRAFIAKLDAFIKALCQHHSALGAITQPVVAGLLQFRGGEGRRSKAPLLFLRDAGNFPLGPLQFGENVAWPEPRSILRCPRLCA